MPVPQRDLELTRKRLTEWFGARLADAENLEISELHGPGATGFSSDTLMFDLSWTRRGAPHREALVVRMEPMGLRVFPDYDLDRQYRLLEILARTDVPVPQVLWQETGSEVLGAPFFIMRRVEGRVPPDSPTYHTQGWVTELRPEERAELWWSGLDTLARIHHLDWRGLGFGFLEETGAAATPIERQLDYYERYLAWAARGKPMPASQAGLAWLRENRPREAEPLALCWGDSRLGNMLFRDNRCVAVLDWEMATLANLEQDVAWWLFFDRHHSEGIHVPRLEGLPSREETVARYEARMGRPLRHLEYYEIFAAFRFSVIMIRVAHQLVNHGLLPADSDFDSTNICTQLLEKMLAAAKSGA